MAYYDSKGDSVVRYYAEKINLLLANKHVLEKVAEVSSRIVHEKDFSVTKFVEEKQSHKESFDIQKQLASEVRKFEFQKKMSFVRRRNPVETEIDPVHRIAISKCAQKLADRIEFFDKNILPELKSQEEELENRFRSRMVESIASVVRNMSTIDFEDQGSVLLLSGKSMSQSGSLSQSSAARPSSDDLLIIPDST